jgi:hypothetical protein
MAAAGVARELDGALLACWEPVLEGDRFFREAFRSHLMHELKLDAKERSTVAGLIERVTAEEVVDVIGYPVAKPLYDSVSGRKLVADLGSGSRPILVVQFGRGKKTAGEYEKAAGAWRANGCTVDTVALGIQENWWLGGGATQGSDHLNEVTVDWFKTHAASSVA